MTQDESSAVKIHTFTKFYWLLERGQPPEYLGRTYSSGSQFVSADAWQAMRFQKKEYAEEFLRLHAYEKTFRAVEHGFVGEQQ